MNSVAFQEAAENSRLIGEKSMDKNKGQLVTIRELTEYYERERPSETRMILTLKLVERIQSLPRQERIRIIRALILILNTNMSTEQAMRRVRLQGV